ncbi:DUF1294 domain-containing protein [Quisquiliibacterium transsilvanicum]|uniref:Uncharacterized membrane protein YsdA (DUF1294 family)/cold shock CspA family protein n=1 Tax=Quisquiliibacterium transsilvanicum TaxID=1549638 RepID=A0A7W8MAX2_9BURK|nr:cold shock and DUF1294 domain-containing protein [Quisquiliibacterium transsilvanicum]MBB5273775.1 uncharacterized membrane protein YsdA (DUF1294 family)/cold shock CspA family protein [Quisquiliibacterium transsilvanicum]
MRFDGRLKSWNDERGFGFIEPALGGEDIFVHVKSFPAGTGRPAAGLRVSFEVELGPQGRKRARAVQLVRPARRRSARRAEPPVRWTTGRVLAIPAFVLVYAAVAMIWSVRPVVALAYLAASVLAFAAYAADKSAAISGRWRTPESTLHMLGLVGGWPGALLAQQLLRHKSSKQSFLFGYWTTVLLNVAGFVAVHSPLVLARV